MTTLHDIELEEYKNISYIKSDLSLIPISNLRLAFDLDDINPKPAFDLDDIHDSDDDEEFVLLTSLLLPKYYTSILLANKHEDKDIEMLFLSELSRLKQSIVKPTDYQKLANLSAKS